MSQKQHQSPKMVNEILRTYFATEQLSYVESFL